MSIRNTELKPGTLVKSHHTGTVVRFRSITPESEGYMFAGEVVALGHDTVGRFIGQHQDDWACGAFERAAG